MKRTLVISALIGMTLVGAAAAQSGGLWVFEPGQVIQSSKINENFATLDRRISVLAGLDELRVQELIDILNRVEPQDLTNALDTLNQTAQRVSALEAQNVAAVNSIALLEQSVACLKTEVCELQTKVCEQGNRLDCVETRVCAVEQKTQYMSVCDTVTIFEGTNVQIRNGQGSTDSTNCLGNLILGYNEDAGFTTAFATAPERTGSHNVIVGRDNQYTGVGSLLQGTLNRSGGCYGVVFGLSNRVGGEYCSVVGGTNNAAENVGSTIGGGRDQAANKHYQWIAGIGGNGLGTLPARKFITLGQDPPE